MTNVTPTAGRRKKRAACRRNITKKIHSRSMAVDNQAQRNRLAALPTEIMLTMHGAVDPATADTSDAIGSTLEMMVMLAVTLSKRSAQSAYHRQVLAHPSVRSLRLCVRCSLSPSDQPPVGGVLVSCLVCPRLLLYRQLLLLLDRASATHRLPLASRVHP